MLFNSFIFIFLFLPITLLGFHLIGSRGHNRLALSWLVGASLFFYGWWNPKYLGLILVSILWNYAVGIYLSRKTSKVALFAGVAGNLALLGYFKYANFFVDNINALTGGGIVLERIILPLAISFFTFQQITYLVDTNRKVTTEHNFLHYLLFITFFPQLIAGPIVHHSEMFSQYTQDTFYKLKAKNLGVGLIIFVIGLFKKVVIADGLAMHANPVFAAAESGIPFTSLEAWGGALAYTFQLYFDFSGYSDMAIGLAQMFSIRLPLNFNSPYKSTSIIDFWRRWHMTLSRFFRDYLYIPLGGNQQGATRNSLNLMITMFLGGLWHGASWTFVLWGALHGIYLISNHGFHAIRRLLGHDLSRGTILGEKVSQLITFAAVVIAWVIFRAESVNGARRMIQEMFGLNGFTFPAMIDFQLLSLLTLSLFVVWCLPNTQEFMHKYKPAIETYKVDSKPPSHYLFRFEPSNFAHALFITVTALLSILALQTNKTSDFLYYNF
ncbi:MAG: MBOAT family protein [Nitrospina sp.]|jgi:alginate O-acetyltransferase complex protein AlgI|nr:MBOAT family protein [Nitrospina sp.]MBT3677110.1 MBOAT family protein [Candidatus Neomarinimicrobiota bacterium]MBT4046719.1 MBOAT family protein [Nitrospina sp.]MBT4374790.1 MBOAT family protein [Nitrospina sp.]MBT4558527.1 MBOAT family protein [Nitrospina sp.]